jgi:NADH-quinone oxidoreductase subunit L
MFRLVFLVFFTKPRFDEAHPPRESPAVMTVPLVLLAIPSAIVGFVGFPPDKGPFHDFLKPVFERPAAAQEAVETASLFILAEGASEAEHHISTGTKVTFGIISTVAAVAGIFLAYLTYVAGRIDPRALATRFRGLYEFLYNKWYFDELYNQVFVAPARWLAMFLWRVVDVRIVDGAVNGVAFGVAAISQRLRHVQTGLVANYALAIALGMVIMVGVYLAAFSNLFR